MQTDRSGESLSAARFEIGRKSANDGRLCRRWHDQEIVSAPAAIESRMSSVAVDTDGWAELRHSSNRSRISSSRAGHAVARRQLEGSSKCLWTIVASIL